VNEQFVREVERVLVPGGRFHLWTDVKEYFDASLQLIAEQSPLHGPFEVDEETALHNLDYRTHFERRVRINGLPVYRAQFAKQPWQVEFTAAVGLPVDASRHQTP
jgi:tRNA (guanine-N7-)-methyltransferase